MSEMHLSRTELVAWRDHGDGDRERIVVHLATCAACRHVAAELERERPLEGDATPVRFHAREFGAAGRQVGAPAPVAPPVTPLRARRLVYLAAAASLALAAIVVPRLFDGPPGMTPRGSGAVVVPLAPADGTTTTSAFTFEWTADPNAGALRLVVMALDDPSTLLLDRDVTGTRYAPTAEERARFQSGREYHWFVEYRGAGGGVTPSTRFRLR